MMQPSRKWIIFEFHVNDIVRLCTLDAPVRELKDCNEETMRVLMSVDSFTLAEAVPSNLLTFYESKSATYSKHIYYIQENCRIVKKCGI